MMKKTICILLALTLCNLSALTFNKVQAEDIYSVVLFEDDFESSVQGDTDSDEDDLSEGNITTVYNQMTETWTLGMIADNKEKALHTYASADAQRGDKGLALYDESSATGKTEVLSPTTMTNGLRNFKIEFELNVPDNARRYFRYHKKASPFLDVRTGSGYNYVKLFSGSTKVDYTPGTWVKIGFIINVDAQEMQLYVGGDLKETCTLTDLTNIPNYFSYETASKTSTVTPSIIDNVKISAPVALVKSVKLSETNDAVIFECNRERFEYEMEAVEITNADGDVIYNDEPAEGEGNNLICTIGETLKPGSYTVKYLGQTYSVGISADVGFDTELLSENFEEAYYPGSGTSIPHSTQDSAWSWELSTAADNYAKMLHVFDESSQDYGKQALALYDEAAGTGKLAKLSPAQMADGLKLFKIEFDLNVPGNARRYFRYHKSATPFLDVYTGSGFNYIKLFDGSIKVDYTPGTWVKIGVIVNMNAPELQLYVDGELKETCQVPSAQSGYIPNYLSFETASKTNESEPSVLDNLKISVPKALKAESVAPANGATDVARNTQIKIECSRDVYYYDEQEIKITDKNGDAVSAVTKASENTLTATFDSELNPNETYTVKYNGETYTFTTANDDVIISKPVLEGSGGSYTATMTLKNSGTENTEATLVVAVFNNENQMVALEYEHKENIAPGAEPSFSVSASAPAMFARAAVAENYRAQAFAVDNMTDLNLLRNDYSTTEDENFSLSGAGVTAFADGLRTGINGAEMTIKGKTALPGERTALLKLSKGGEIKHLELLATDENGVLEHTFSPAGADNSKWSVVLSGRKLTDWSKEVFVSTTDLQASVMAAITVNNADVTKANFENGVNYKDALNIDSKYFTSNGYAVISEQKQNKGEIYIDEFIEIGDLMIEAQNVLDGANSASWSSLSEYVSGNSEILMKDDTTEGYSYYSALTPANQNIINKAIKEVDGVKCTYSDIKSFRTAFTQKVNAYQNGTLGENNSLPSEEGSGDVSTSITVGKPSSGGGGGGGSQKSEQPEKEEESVTQTPETSFPDMDSAAWAQDSVNFLYEKGIVSGDTNGNFRPLDNVKREEFVKMLVEVFALEQSTECTFTDVSENAWYKPYLAAAQSAGIISGKSDGSFGAGENISRQDMAVMIFRALEKAAVSIEKADGSFSDMNDISAYALEAVFALQNKGIISGVGNGVFAPLENANRAQAATIIYNLFGKGVIE